MKSIRKLFQPLLFILLTSLLTGGVLFFFEHSQKTEVSGNEGGHPTPKKELAASETGETLAYKNETVYVVLDPEGRVIEQSIVNRIYHCDSEEAGMIKDYGSYQKISNMTSGAEPVLQDNMVLWDSELLSDGDIYYEGITGKSLPVDFKIDYYLDGETIEAAALAGKSGELQIVIKVKNNLAVEGAVAYRDYHGKSAQKQDVNYIPLLVQGTYTADLNRFSDIEAGDGVGIVTGQNMNISFMAFPYPEAEIVLTMRGEDIELNQIMMVIIPQLPPIPEVDMEDDLVELIDGISAVSEGLTELHDGADQIYQGFNQFRNESKNMLSEMEPLVSLIEEFAGLIDETVSNIDEYMPEDLEEMLRQIEELLEQLDELPDPAAVSGEILSIKRRIEKLEEQNSSLGRDGAELSSTSALVASEAHKLIAENEEGSELYELGRLLLTREEQINRVVAGSGVLARDLTGLHETAAALQSTWDETFMQKLVELLDNREDAGKRLEQMLDHLRSFYEALLEFGEHIDDISGLYAKAEEIFEKLNMLPGALDELVGAQKMIRDGIGEINVRGILEMKKGLVDGVNEIRFGKAKVDLMRSLADGYRSHADNENNVRSSVQFILQTETIERQETETPDFSEKENEQSAMEKAWYINLWSRFLDLFASFYLS
jgi:putative membrane protein